MEYFLLGGSIVIVVLFLLWWHYHTPRVSLRKVKGKPIASCPLCGMQLFKGETLVSKVFRPMDVPDQRCIVSGCPHCYPVTEPGLTRICPVCHHPVDASGYLVSRLFNRTEGKKHVMVVGCNVCLPGEPTITDAVAGTKK